MSVFPEVAGIPDQPAKSKSVPMFVFHTTDKWYIGRIEIYQGGVLATVMDGPFVFRGRLNSLQLPRQSMEFVWEKPYRRLSPMRQGSVDRLAWLAIRKLSWFLFFCRLLRIRVEGGLS
jgi:hypothetical protein